MVREVALDKEAGSASEPRKEVLWGEGWEMEAVF